MQSSTLIFVALFACAITWHCNALPVNQGGHSEGGSQSHAASKKGAVVEDIDADLAEGTKSKSKSKSLSKTMWGHRWHRWSPHVHIPHRHHIHVPHVHVPHRHHIHVPHVHVPHRHHIHVPHLHTAKMIKDAKDAVAKAAKDAKDAAAKAVKDAADLAKKKAADLAKAAKDAFNSAMKEAKDAALKLIKDKILPKLVEEANWSPKEYRDFMLRIPKDFTGSQLDNSDDYAGYTKNADAVTQRVMKVAFGNMPHQDKCKVMQRNNGWNEKHATPFAEIAKLPKGPFSVYPFKAQYENDKDGYFAQPCNAISNGYFLSMFDMPEMASTGNCGSAASGFAMDCIDEKHLLQIAIAAMPFGSWYMHGDGGSALGGFLDVRGMWVEFYFLYRLMLNHFVHDDATRARLVMPGCNKDTVPDEEDGIKWVNQHGERMCHLYWSRNFKKGLLDPKLTMASNETKGMAKLMKGVPEMELSIAGVVLVSLRAVFHKKFPFGDEIYTKLTAKIIDTLMAKAPEEMRVAMKEFTAALDADKILGFENPHDGVGAVVDIFADFMDAMFWQESGKFGPATEAIKEASPPTAGCTWQPHSVWHRKATRVIAGFTKIAVSLKAKLKHPSAMTEFKFCGLKPCGVWVEIAGAVDDIVGGLVKVWNMKRLNSAELRPSHGGKDILDVPALYSTIKTKFGDGWPKVGNFVGDKWPKCSLNGTASPCSFTHRQIRLVPTLCDTTAPTAEPTAAPTAEPTAEPTTIPTATPTEAPTTLSPTTDGPSFSPTHTPTEEPTAVPTFTPTAAPTFVPTATPSAEPTAAPSGVPSGVPTAKPTAVPTDSPDLVPRVKALEGEVKVLEKENDALQEELDTIKAKE